MANASVGDTPRRTIARGAAVRSRRRPRRDDAHGVRRQRLRAAHARFHGRRSAILVPRIARYREQFYERCCKRMTGPHAQRFVQEAKSTRQPFGARPPSSESPPRPATRPAHAAAASRPVLRGARLSRREPTSARHIPVASVRMLTEMHIHLSTGQMLVRSRPARRRRPSTCNEVEDLLKPRHRLRRPRRSVEHPRLPGPVSRASNALEDSIRDTSRRRSHLRGGCALQLLRPLLTRRGRTRGRSSRNKISARGCARLAAWWDRFATTTVSRHPPRQRRRGDEVGRARRQGAHAMARTRRGDGRPRRSGDSISIASHSAKAFALVVDALLAKQRLPRGDGAAHDLAQPERTKSRSKTATTRSTRWPCAGCSACALLRRSR